MPENWDFYFCRVNDAIASIFVDLAPYDHGPDDARPWLHWVWLQMRAPRPDGLSDAAEAPTLGTIGDRLTARLASSGELQMVGRITTQGRREFYFYGPGSDGQDAEVATVLQSFPGYEAEVGCEFDAEWGQYFDLLYPSASQRQQIANRRILEALARHGDIHEKPRPVRHWIYFPDEAGRSMFVTRVQPFGYTAELSEHPDQERPFGVCLEQISTVDHNTIDAAVETLRSMLGDDAEYDGWETQVEAPPTSTWWRRLVARVT